MLRYVQDLIKKLLSIRTLLIICIVVVILLIARFAVDTINDTSLAVPISFSQYVGQFYDANRLILLVIGSIVSFVVIERLIANSLHAIEARRAWKLNHSGGEFKK